MSQNSILLEKSLHFSVRIVKLHRLLHRHEDDLSAELLKHAAAIGSAVSCADCALSRRDLAESLNEALRETARTEYWLRLLALTDDVDVRSFPAERLHRAAPPADRRGKRCKLS